MADLDPGYMNRRLKKLLEARPFGTATESFIYEWEGPSRVPESIKFPDGTERKVAYMRDGILNFRDDDKQATYGRFSDHPSPRKIIVVYHMIDDPRLTN